MERFKNSSFDGNVNDFIDRDSTKFSWDENQLKWVARGIKIPYSIDRVYSSVYRPFAKCHAYFERSYNSRVYRLPLMFPKSTSRNLAICVSGIGSAHQTAFMVDTLPDIQIVGNGQCFPLYRYTEQSQFQNYHDLHTNGSNPRRTSNICESALNSFQSLYPSINITAECLFYYVYGILHSPDYRQRFATNLLKQLPHIPAVKSSEDFIQISRVGRRLGMLHVQYEDIDEYPLDIQLSTEIHHNDIIPSQYRVVQMKFAKYPGGRPDRSIIAYNPIINVTGIPLAAYEYIVNGKSAIEWVMERQCVKIDKASGILNDANKYATETVRDPCYPLKLLKKIVNLSLQTVNLIKELPTLEFHHKS